MQVSSQFILVYIELRHGHKPQTKQFIPQTIPWQHGHSETPLNTLQTYKTRTVQTSKPDLYYFRKDIPDQEICKTMNIKNVNLEAKYYN